MDCCMASIMVAADTACMSSAFFSTTTFRASDVLALARLVAVLTMLLVRATSMVTPWGNGGLSALQKRA